LIPFAAWRCSHLHAARGVTDESALARSSSIICRAKLKKAGGALHLVSVQGFVEEALAMTSVNKIVPLYSTTAQAAGHFHLASNAGSDC